MGALIGILGRRGVDVGVVSGRFLVPGGRRAVCSRVLVRAVVAPDGEESLAQRPRPGLRCRSSRWRGVGV
eukprot:4871157-Prymnesium_polylepis.1